MINKSNKIVRKHHTYNAEWKSLFENKDGLVEFKPKSDPKSQIKYNNEVEIIVINVIIKSKIILVELIDNTDPLSYIIN